MLVDKLTPSPDWAAMATARLVKCTAADFVHFTADFGDGLIAHRLAILSGTERAEAWQTARDAVQGIGRTAEAGRGEKVKRSLPDWLKKGG
jgi:hypothetical protein